MRLHIEGAILVALLAASTIGTASAESESNDRLAAVDSAILATLGIQAAGADILGSTPEIDITNFDWIDQDRISFEVVGESKTEPRGLFKVDWDRRQVAKIKLLRMPPTHCAEFVDELDAEESCYLVADTSEHDELKAPLGGWHVTNEEFPADIYTGLPSVGHLVKLPELRTALPQ